jgi:hypothetical protein
MIVLPDDDDVPPPHIRLAAREWGVKRTEDFAL